MLKFVTAVLCTTALATGAQAAITHAPFGKTAEGKPIEVYTLTNAKGMEARIMTYGGTLVSLKAPDRKGQMGEVVLGFDSAEPYVAGVPFYGAIIGRYGNRIAGGKFALDGKTYQLPLNDGKNSLHGGTKGFDKRLWTAEPVESKQGPALKLTYVSADGEEGYPGTLTVHVTYQLRNDNSLDIKYEATTDKPTVVNLTNHSYFNLSGNHDKPILDHLLKMRT
jgi:aldose 1-epimerase